MRALAEFIMRGRAQAALIAVLIIPLIPQAALALVTLRRGAAEGLMLLPWAILPTLLMWWGNSGDGVWPFVIAGLIGVVGVYIGALLLRAQGGWALTSIVIAGLTLVSGVIYLVLFDASVTALLDQWIEVQKQALDSRGIEYDESVLQLPPNSDFIGVGAFGVLVNMLLALVLGRWWQALLYNPGGFGQEFRQLRLSAPLALVCVIPTALCMLLPQYRLWALVSAMPLVLVSISIAHQFAATQRMGKAWLVIFYIALANLPFFIMIAVLGLADTWLDIRSRLISKTANSKSRDDDSDK